MKHYFRSAYGCPVHKLGYSEKDRHCSCRSYWADDEKERISDKAWREDHDRRECAAKGGACAG